MYWQIVDVLYLEKYKLLLTFRDSSKKIVDLEAYLTGPIFEPLKNQEYFKSVKLNTELDSIYWDNGADFAPEFLYEKGIDEESTDPRAA